MSSVDVSEGSAVSSAAVDHRLIRASAGTGKTFQLTNRYIRLLLSAEPDHILATTFSRKAAGEILDRILKRLAEAAMSESEAETLAGFLGMPALRARRFRHELAKLTRQIHRLQIGTLDSFFVRLASGMSWELGLAPGWRILDPLEETALQNRAVAILLEENNPADLHRMLQFLAPGKSTRSVTGLLQRTISAYHDIYLLTEESAWQQVPEPPLLSSLELAGAIEAAAGAPVPKGTAFLNAHNKCLAAARESRWEDFVAETLVQRVVAGEPKYRQQKIPEPLAAAYQPLLRQARAVLCREMRHQTQATFELLQRYHTVYERLLREERVLGFADITRTLAQRLPAHDLDHAAYRMDAGVDHLLLDEFQDTSLIQWDVLESYAKRVTEHDGGSFFCVGDAKQAIYGWRGGEAALFDTLPVKLPAIVEASLNVSRRSAQPVIDVVNRIFSNLTRHTKLGRYEDSVRNWQQQFPEHQTAQRTEGCVSLQTGPSKCSEDMLPFVAERIAEWAGRHPQASIGVLTRSNKTVAQLIFELRKRNLPASEEGGNPLTDSAAVELVLSLLNLADHPGDTICRFHLANSPWGGVLGLKDYRDETAAHRLARRVRRQLMDEGYGATLFSWTQELAEFCSRRDLRRLLQLVQLGYDFPAHEAIRTRRFIELVRERRADDPSEDRIRVMTIHQAKGLQFDIVVLPDLDRSFGQPAPSFGWKSSRPGERPDAVCVYRGAAIQAVLPADLQQLFVETQSRDVQEELCNLYVALTRAVHALHMIVPPASSLACAPSGLIRAALLEEDDAEPNAMLYEHGDPNWRLERTFAEARPARLAEPVEIRLPTAADRSDRSSRAASLERVAPSQLEGGGKVRASHLLRAENRAALARGTILHAWFEQIGWLEDGVPEDNELIAAVRSIDAADQELAELLTEFRAMLELPEIRNVLSRSCYAEGSGDQSGSVEPELHRERDFAIALDQVLLSGTFDRLVVLNSDGRPVAAELLDFKTDAIGRGDSRRLTERVAFYRSQLESYRTAVEHVFQLPREAITSKLVMLQAGRVIDVC